MAIRSSMRSIFAKFASVSILTAVIVCAAIVVAQAAGPLPRFMSLRADEVNLRTGPGVRYPVEWKFVRRNWPVEVIAEFENWLKIRDGQGTEGWVHSSMLSGRRSIVVAGKPGEERMLRRIDQDGADAVARLEPGVVAWLLRCPQGSEYCQIEVRNKRGWLKRDALWGVHKTESFE